MNQAVFILASFIPVEMESARRPESFVSGSRSGIGSQDETQAGSICAIVLFQVAILRPEPFQN